MNTAQLHDQRLLPRQETENVKAEPLLSIHQTLIDHSMDVIIDSSGLAMDNGNSPVGFIEEIFTRLTRRLVFEFLGGHARMEELPCLGDGTNGNDKFHRTTPIPMEQHSESNQIKLLDSTGNLHLSSIAFIDSDFNPRIEDYLCESVLLDSFDAYSTTFISSLEQFPNELISQSADHANEESQCSPINHLIIAKTIAEMMAESLCDSDFSETQVFMESDGDVNGIDFMSVPIPVSSNQSEKKYSETPVSEMAYPKDDLNFSDMSRILASETHNYSVNASIIHSTSNGDSVSSMDCIFQGHPCIDKFGDSNKLLATISTNESFPKFSIPDPKHLNNFLYGNFKFPMFLTSELSNEKLDTFDYPSLLEDSDSVDSTDMADLSDNKLNDQSNEGVCCYDQKTLETPGLLIGLENGSSSVECKEMEVSVTLKISDPCYTEPLDTHWPTGVDSSSFDVTDHEELLESFRFNNQDEYNDIDYTCASPIWPGKMDVPWNEVNQMKLTDSASNEDPLSSFYDENSKNSVYLPLLVDSSVDYLFQGHLSDDELNNLIEEPILGTTEKSLVYARPDPDTLYDYLYGNLKSPIFLAPERMNKSLDKHDSLSLYGACYSDDCGDEASSSDNCNVELLDSDSFSKDPSTLPFEFNDHYELLEVYGLNIQDQYTDTGYSCSSPTWPGKIAIVSKGQTQKTYLIPNLTKDDNANRNLTTADPSLFHSNTDETSVVNKDSFGSFHNGNPDTSVSSPHLNQRKCTFNTSSLHNVEDCLSQGHLSDDGFENSIEEPILGTTENSSVYAIPNPDILEDFIFGNLDSPTFLTSELQNKKVDIISNSFGASCSDDCAEVSNSSDNCNVELFDSDSSCKDPSAFPFDFIDHNELLARYGLNEQDQYTNDFICESPTWPGKV